MKPLGMPAWYSAHFRQKFALEGAIEFHSFAPLEANMPVTNGIPLGGSLLLPVGTVNSAQTLKERELVKSWRDGFGADFLFIAVQLPGYLGDCGTYAECMAELFAMRLQQQAGLVGFNSPSTAMATVTPTYDLGCPFGVKTTACPFGSVHNVNKQPIAARIAAQIMGRQNYPDSTQWPGPRLLRVEATSHAQFAKGKGKGTPLQQMVGAQAGGAVNMLTTVSITYAQALYQRATAWCAFSDINLHSRMTFDPTHVRLKLLQACGQ
jgi:hypothetical protein